MMKFCCKFWTALAVLGTFGAVRAHGDHGSPPKEGETMAAYAQRHMAMEHHIDAFDPASFFILHDLDSDGFWSREEIEAVYGVHHPYSKEKTPQKEEHDAKAKMVVDGVLKAIDLDGDGLISLRELEAAGLEALPDFSSIGAEGHHYDIESEFFLHHEEQFHSTPETQTDESYNHPEDLAHFEHHEKIELEEENKERQFQGLPAVEKLAHEGQSEADIQAAIQKAIKEAQEHFEAEQKRFAQARENPDHILPMDGSGHALEELPDVPNPRYTRAPKNPGVDDTVKQAAKDAREKPSYGEGPDGFKRPKNAGDRMRRNLPYKYKFRRSWGDF